ncbi:MAG: hypothetical protein K9H16_02615, partial [Bacteroidales bacterium]|nr:hypothetical protein [Bacteroidales bacterium]
MNTFYFCNCRLYLLVILTLIISSIGAKEKSGNPAINSKIDFVKNQSVPSIFWESSEINFDSLLNIGNTKSSYVIPPGWNDPINTGNVAGVIIAYEADPNINGIPINQGDMIGAFFVDENGDMRCGGIIHWPDTAGIVMTVYGDDNSTPEKEGFAYAEYINYKLFSWEYMAEFDVDQIELDPEFPSNNKWYKLALPRLLDMSCFEDLWVKATSDIDSLCNEAVVSFDVEVIEGAENISYNWTSIPAGFSSAAPDPQFNINETTLFILEATDGINQFTAFKPIFVSHDPQVFAGENLATCGVEIIALSGFAEFTSSVLWTSSGDGTFVDSASLATDYYLGENDFLDSLIVFYLTGLPSSPCEIQSSDVMEVEIFPTPVINLPETYSICKNQPVFLNPIGTNLSDVLWETSGNGTFSDPTSLNTIYYHGTYGNTHPSVTLTITGQGIDPCDFTVVEQTVVFINKNAYCSSGPDATICEGENYLTCGGAAYADTIIWTTSGDGTFADNSKTKTLYYPGEFDILNGSVILIIHVTSNPPCTASPSSDMLLTILDGPEIDAGIDIGACGNPIVPLNAIGNNYSTVEWSTNGDGTFEESSELSTVYTAGSSDIVNGTIELIIQAGALPPCTEGSADTLIINFEGGATASAGPDLSVCNDESVLIQGMASNYIALQWSTSGDGSFVNPNTLITEYYPGTNDIGAGEVIITLTPEGAPPCNIGIADEMLLSIIIPATLQVPVSSFQICETDIIFLNAIATNFSSIIWGTTGDGTFDNKYIQNPKYTPGIQDIQNGELTLNISVSSYAPCNQILNENIGVAITPKPTAYAGSSGHVCESDSFHVNGTANFSGETDWSTTGDGYFDDPSQSETFYHPGFGDLQQGNVVLTFTAVPLQPCNTAASDELSLIIDKNPTCDAGINQTICETNNLILSGSAQNQQSVVWESSGDGTFSNTAVYNPTYFPGIDDLQNTLVTLTLHALAKTPCTLSAQDDMILNIQPEPIVSIGSDFTICATDIVELEGEADNYQSTLWTSFGDGTFDDANELSTFYTPGPQDLLDRDIEICLSAEGEGFCGLKVTCINVHVEKNPVVIAGPDGIAPVNNAYYIADAETYYHTSVLWTTSGSGTFSNAGYIRNFYTPDENDLALNTVILTLTAQPKNPCTLVVSDNLELEVISGCVDAVADAGNDKSLCIGQFNVVMLLDAVAENYESLHWTTSGNGIFSNASLLHPSYIASTNDTQSGSVQLCLMANAHGICQDSADCITVFFQQPPSALAGYDQTICQGNPVLLSGQVSNAAESIWVSSGDGDFDNKYNTDTYYTPGENDLMSGNVELCLNAIGLGNCESTSSCLNISISPLPEVSSGDDQTVCSGSIIEVSAEGSNYSLLTWETFGDGSFINPGSLNTIYMPGQNDLAAGNVSLCINAHGINNCGTVNDCTSITFINAPTAFAGSDETICENQSILLSGFAENFSQIIWETNGDGTFDNIILFNASYFPGISDMETGMAELCLKVTGIEDCGFAVDCKSVEIIKSPIVEAGENITVCEDQNILLDGSSEFSSSVLWTTFGDGTFDNPDIYNAQYFPGIGDKSAGFVQLCLNASGAGDCPEVSDCLELTINQNPLAFAGTASNICEGDTIILNGNSQNSVSTVWNSSGNGTFSNPDLLQTYYFPCATDIINGEVNLCLVAFGTDGCGFDESCINVNIQIQPYAFIGGNITACSNEPVELVANVDHHQGFVWHSSGTGSFTSPNNLVTTYLPSNEDVLSGNIQICLEAFGISGCNNVEVCKEVSFIGEPMANAGNDLTICEDQSAGISGVADNYSNVNWFTDGDGTFENKNLLFTQYFPGQSDIEAGIVELCLNVMSAGNCNNVSDCMNLYINSNPEVFAGDNFIMLEPDTFNTSQASAINYYELLWETSGTGYFENANITVTNYFPSAADYQSGLIVLTLSANPLTPCTIVGNDALNLQFIFDCFDATSNAGEDGAVCMGGEYQLNGTASDYASVMWTSSGTGTFDDAG